MVVDLLVSRPPHPMCVDWPYRTVYPVWFPMNRCAPLFPNSILSKFKYQSRSNDDGGFLQSGPRVSMVSLELILCVWFICLNISYLILLNNLVRLATEAVTVMRYCGAYPGCLIWPYSIMLSVQNIDPIAIWLHDTSQLNIQNVC